MEHPLLSFHALQEKIELCKAEGQPVTVEIPKSSGLDDLKLIISDGRVCISSSSESLDQYQREFLFGSPFILMESDLLTTPIEHFLICEFIDKRISATHKATGEKTFAYLSLPQEKVVDIVSGDVMSFNFFFNEYDYIIPTHSGSITPSELYTDSDFWRDVESVKWNPEKPVHSIRNELRGMLSEGEAVKFDDILTEKSDSICNVVCGCTRKSEEDDFDISCFSLFSAASNIVAEGYESFNDVISNPDKFETYYERLGVMPSFESCSPANVRLPGYPFTVRMIDSDAESYFKYEAMICKSLISMFDPISYYGEQAQAEVKSAKKSVELATLFLDALIEGDFSFVARKYSKEIVVSIMVPDFEYNGVSVHLGLWLSSLVSEAGERFMSEY